MQSVKRLFPVIFFGMAILCSKLWFYFNYQRTNNPLFLKVNLEMPSFEYRSLALRSSVAEALGTSNLLNGNFVGQNSNKVSMFSAEWAEGEGDTGAFFLHSPQICWVGAGFRTVRTGEPSEWPILIAGRTIPFQCCVLSHPDLEYPEIVLWAASVDGEWSKAVYALPRELILGDEPVRDKVIKMGNNIKRRIRALLSIIVDPPPLNGAKQFLRVSTPLTADWRSGLVNLEAFVHQSISPREHQRLNRAD
jgi:hypothetical protein